MISWFCWLKWLISFVSGLEGSLITHDFTSPCSVIIRNRFGHGSKRLNSSVFIHTFDNWVISHPVVGREGRRDISWFTWNVNDTFSNFIEIRTLNFYSKLTIAFRRWKFRCWRWLRRTSCNSSFWRNPSEVQCRTLTRRTRHKPTYLSARFVLLLRLPTLDSPSKPRIPSRLWPWIN